MFCLHNVRKLPVESIHGLDLEICWMPSNLNHPLLFNDSPHSLSAFFEAPKSYSHTWYTHQRVGKRSNFPSKHSDKLDSVWNTNFRWFPQNGYKNGYGSVGTRYWSTMDQNTIHSQKKAFLWIKKLWCRRKSDKAHLKKHLKSNLPTPDFSSDDCAHADV